MNNFIYGIGDFFYAFFGMLKNLGNVPNYIFIAVGFFGLFYWLYTQKKFNKKAEEQGGLK